MVHGEFDVLYCAAVYMLSAFRHMQFLDGQAAMQSSDLASDSLWQPCGDEPVKQCSIASFHGCTPTILQWLPHTHPDQL